ncbi:MAG TPA: glycosyltransferase family 4 protein, partial [Anaerolineae bacterium]|nr:glycosyltransferase family 4 protein [Anaerolineae bacterium]
WRAKKLFQYNLQAANCIICVSKPLKHHLVTEWGISAEKILVFPNGVDVQRFNPNPSTRAEIRTSLGIQDNPMALFVGNFYEWHDVKTLLAAFAKVIPSHPDARLVLVGDGDRRQAMEQYAAELGLEHAVKFTGLVPHATVPSLMNAADIAIAPVPIMERDSWLSPLKLYEYMASGTALVASKVGQIADVVQDGHNGLLVPPGEATALADMINKLISEPSLRSQLGRQAREDAVRKHSWAQYISRLEQVFDAVIAGQPVSTL